MIPAVITAAWVGAVLLAAGRLRLPRRVARVVAAVPAGHGHRRTRRTRAVASVLAVTCMAIAGHPLLGLAAPAAVVVVPRWRRLRAARIAVTRRAAALPDLVELVAAGIAAGCSARQAFLSSVDVAPLPLRAACERLRQRLSRGERFADALHHLAGELGAPARPIVNALRAHERDGVPLHPTLERIAADARRQRRQHAEAAIRRLPVRLSVPLVTCTLSAFAVLTVVPLGAATLRSLQGEFPSNVPTTGHGLGAPAPQVAAPSGGPP